MDATEDSACRDETPIWPPLPVSQTGDTAEQFIGSKHAALFRKPAEARWTQRVLLKLSC